MPSDLDLDDRIRALVSAAVADAPTAPDITQLPTQPVARKRASWPKWTAVLAALLAAGGATVALQPSNEGDVDTTRDTTPTTQFAPRQEPSVIVTVGPDGIIERVGNDTRSVSRERVVQAVPLDNGDIAAVRSFTDTRVSDTPPVRVAADGTMTPLFEHPPTGYITLYDFSIVDGRRLLLYSVNSGASPSAATGRKVVLYALDLDTQAITDVAPIGDDFSDTSSISLGSNGLIVGSHSVTSACGFCNDPSAGSRNLFVVAVPGSPAAARPLPQPGDYGLKDKYADGACECPMNFFTDATGTSLYWVSTKLDGTGTAVFAARIDEPGKSPTLLKALPDYGATVEETFPAISSRGIVVSYANRGKGNIHGPVLLEGGTVVDLGGNYALIGWQG